MQENTTSRRKQNGQSPLCVLVSLLVLVLVQLFQWQVFYKFQFFKQIQGCASLLGNPVYALCETEHLGHLNVRGVLRHYVPYKRQHPLAHFTAILWRQKQRDCESHAVCVYNCLTNTLLITNVFLFNKQGDIKPPCNITSDAWDSIQESGQRC